MAKGLQMQCTTCYQRLSLRKWPAILRGQKNK